MKSFFTTTALLTLATSTLAFPPSTLRHAKRQLTCADPGQQATVDAINSWNVDVDTVNAFLDTTPSISQDYLDLTMNALMSANNEPVQLGVLACIQGLADNAEQAITLLMEVFGNVPTDLTNIINDVEAGDLAGITEQITEIGNVRCCNVLPALDILWQAAADDEGVSDQVNTAVPRPAQCASIQC